MTTNACCGCDIYSCHAELVHTAGEIQYPLVPFTAADWRGTNFLRVIQAGTPGNNEIGPHGMPFGSYSVTIYKKISANNVRKINVNILIDRSNGEITFWKTGNIPAFSGWVEIR